MRILGVHSGTYGSFTISSPAPGKNKLTEIHFNHHNGSSTSDGESCRVGFILGDGSFTSYTYKLMCELEVTVSGTTISYDIESGGTGYNYVSIIVYEVET